MRKYFNGAIKERKQKKKNGSHVIIKMERRWRRRIAKFGSKIGRKRD